MFEQYTYEELIKLTNAVDEADRCWRPNDNVWAIYDQLKKIYKDSDEVDLYMIHKERKESMVEPLYLELRRREEKRNGVKELPIEVVYPELTKEEVERYELWNREVGPYIKTKVDMEWDIKNEKEITNPDLEKIKKCEEEIKKADEQIDFLTEKYL
jgi:hypothetical protein